VRAVATGACQTNGAQAAPELGCHDLLDAGQAAIRSERRTGRGGARSRSGYGPAVAALALAGWPAGLVRESASSQGRRRSLRQTRLPVIASGGALRIAKPVVAQPRLRTFSRVTLATSPEQLLRKLGRPRGLRLAGAPLLDVKRACLRLGVEFSRAAAAPCIPSPVRHLKLVSKADAMPRGRSGWQRAEWEAVLPVRELQAGQMLCGERDRRVEWG